MPTDTSAARPALVYRTPDPHSGGCGFLSPVQRAPWALRLPIARDLPLSVSRNIQRFGGQATMRPHNAQDSALTLEKLNIERYVTV